MVYKGKIKGKGTSNFSCAVGSGGRRIQNGDIVTVGWDVYFDFKPYTFYCDPCEGPTDNYLYDRKKVPHKAEDVIRDKRWKVKFKV